MYLPDRGCVHTLLTPSVYATGYTDDRPHFSHILLPLRSQRLGRYQIILLGDRGTCVWTVCPGLLPGSGTAGSPTSDLTIVGPTC